MIRAEAYWPPFFYKNPKAVGMTFIYETVPNLDQWSSVFRYDANTNSMTLVQLDKDGKFMNRWYLRSDLEFGVAEWRDDVPQTGFWAWFCGPNKKVVMDPAIGWGDIIEIGKTYANQPQFSTFKCCPPQIGTGSQIIVWEQLHDQFTLHNGKSYNNVLQFLYKQSWNDGLWRGARMWMALDALPGFGGPIANQWAAQNTDGSIVEMPRQDAIAITIW